LEEKNYLFEMNDDWMGNGEEPLKGFTWKSGPKRDTTGIVMWSDVFLHTIDQTGEKIAIFVMDTQGLFDNQSTPTDNSRIFALGTLISSIQVLNLMNRTQEDQLQYLQFATEFAKFASKNKKDLSVKAFQNLTFLIRDWNNEDDFKYGTEGGAKYIKDILTPKSDQNQELQSVRETIFDSFEKIECCLLPYPGKVVACRKSYDGRWSEMDEDFKVQLKGIIEYILLPTNLIPKRINSKDVRVSEMKKFIKNFLNLFKSNEIPMIESIYEYTVENHMVDLIDKCVDDYKLTVYRNADIITEENLQTVHEKCKEKALELYRKDTKLGTTEHEEKYKNMLDNEIEKNFAFFNDRNEQKLVELEMERKRQETALQSEKQQKTEAEEALKQALEKLKAFEARADEMSAVEFEMHKVLYESRISAEQNRLRELELTIQSNESFRNSLIVAAGTTALVIGTMMFSGIPAGLNAVTGASNSITQASIAVGTTMAAISDTTSLIKCSIM